MKKTQSSKLNALLAVQALFASNPTVIANLVALEAAAEELTELITSLNTNLKIQSSPSGAAQAKQEVLAEAGDLAYEIAGGVLSFAEKSGDLALAARVRFSRSGVIAGSGNAISARLQLIIDVATETVESLADHGVTPAKISALKQRFKTYDAVRLLPRQAVAAAGAATRQLERHFASADRLLKNRIDKLVWQFRAKTPEFYEKYQVARTVVSAPTKTNGDTPVITPVVNTTPAVNTTPTAKAA
ncbi:MAG: hypothetical protein L0Z50_41195 [Verrucomicrobiales bacterium]|nr:hypothetical protein [Verrucomicrobiales bacterium]